MYTVTIDISENEDLKTLLGESMHAYVDYKCTGETVDEDRLNKLNREITSYLKKMVGVTVEVAATYSVSADQMDVLASIKLGLK